jgi:hypothetical protein
MIITAPLRKREVGRDLFKNIFYKSPSVPLFQRGTFNCDAEVIN